MDVSEMYITDYVLCLLLKLFYVRSLITVIGFVSDEWKGQ